MKRVPINLLMLVCRLEAVLYSLTAGAPELLQLRTPALPDLHAACAAASLACAKPSSSSQVQTHFFIPRL